MYFNQNNTASSIMCASLEKIITMINDDVIDWEKNSRKFFREEWTNEKALISWIKANKIKI